MSAISAISTGLPPQKLPMEEGEIPSKTADSLEKSSVVIGDSKKSAAYTLFAKVLWKLLVIKIVNKASTPYFIADLFWATQIPKYFTRLLAFEEKELTGLAKLSSATALGVEAGIVTNAVLGLNEAGFTAAGVGVAFASLLPELQNLPGRILERGVATAGSIVCSAPVKASVKWMNKGVDFAFNSIDSTLDFLALPAKKI